MTFYMFSRTKLKVQSEEPWQYYHRFTGGGDDGGWIAIDIDTLNNLWRTHYTSGPDESLIWDCESSKHYPNPKDALHPFPKLPLVTATHLLPGGKNGTWIDPPPGPTYKARLTHFPELKLWANGLADFLKRHDYEPFLRIFQDLSLEDGDELPKHWLKRWSRKTQDDLVMRTASFGLGNQRLDMCVRGGDLGRDAQWAENNKQWEGGLQMGVSEDALVAFAVISALRLRLLETGIREFTCIQSGCE